MGAPHNLTGKRYGRLVAVRQLGLESQGMRWELKCDCGATTTAIANKLKSGNKRSCGCLQRDATVDRFTTHGQSMRTRAYTAWRAAKTRCYNKNWWAYDRYGGRGITMCDRWKDSFVAFFEDMGECPPDFTIEREDNDKGYEPGNCRWVQKSEQHVTKTGVIVVEHLGKKMNLTQFAKAVNVPYRKLYHKINKTGASPHEAARMLSERWLLPLGDIFVQQIPPVDPAAVKEPPTED